MGHYCRICGRERANEAFSGSGHKQHICKECKRMPKKEREHIEQFLEIHGFMYQKHISKKNVIRLRFLAASEAFDIAQLAKLVLEVARIKPYKKRRVKALAKKHKALLRNLYALDMIDIEHETLYELLDMGIDLFDEDEGNDEHIHDDEYTLVYSDEDGFCLECLEEDQFDYQELYYLQQTVASLYDADEYNYHPNDDEVTTIYIDEDGFVLECSEADQVDYDELYYLQETEACLYDADKHNYHMNDYEYTTVYIDEDGFILECLEEDQFDYDYMYYVLEPFGNTFIDEDEHNHLPYNNELTLVYINDDGFVLECLEEDQCYSGMDVRD